MRVRTGVEGFDPLVGGGLPEAVSVVLRGPSGNEKDTFGHQFLAEGLRAGDAVVVVVSSTTPEQYLESLAKLGVNVKEAIAGNRLKVVDWHAYQEESVAGVEERDHVYRASVDLTNVGIALSRALTALAPGTTRRAVLEILSPALQAFEVGQVYAFAQSTKAKLSRHRVTALFLLEKEMHDEATVSSVSQPFDGVIEIERRREGDEIVRKVGVLSLKDTVPDAKFHVFHILADRGIRVVGPGASVPEPTPAPTRAAPPTPPASARSRASGPPAPAAPSNRAQMILRIAEERIRIDPSDTDALFAKASALAAMEDYRGAIGALDALARVSDTYPGLWVLRAKLAARLGDIRGAQESRRKAEDVTMREDAKARTGDTVPCPLCEGPVPVDAHECPNCGARFIEEVGLAEELDSLGKAAIQDKVREEMRVQPETGAPEERRPADRVVPSRPPAPAPETGRRGMTNGLAREARRGPTGRTNGLTNGLKGRTNGLTNGLRGRTNGLTNGLRGRTNGLTNGLKGRTNGITNGLRGRTNGLTNGLVNGLASMRRGMTNGLTNGNGFTNGLGSARFRRETSVNRWKLYVIPLLSVVLLLLPLLGPTSLQTRAYPIAIDGSFGDWGSAALASVPPRAGVATNIDLVRFGVADNLDYLAFYFQVNGTALAGGGSPPTVDTFRAFIDVDRDPATGYAVRGHGADRLIELSGWGGAVNASTLWEWDTNRDPKDWNGWIKAASIPAAVAGASAEAQVDWLSLATDRPAMDVLLHAQAHDGSEDEADYVVSTTAGSLRVVETPVAPEILSGSNVQLLRLDLLGAVRPVTYDALTVTLTGTAPTTSVSAVHLVDGNGSLLGDRIPMSNRIAFQFTPRSLGPGQSDRLFVVADVTAANGDTLGARVDAPLDVVAGDAAVTVALSPAARDVGHLAFVPAAATVDGGFSEWTTVRTDPVGNPGLPARLDVTEYAFSMNAQRASAYLRVAGRALDGAVVPARNGAAPAPGTGVPDSDRDTVPDDVEFALPNPDLRFDFNNDGLADVATGNDVDNDTVLDYPTGSDYWLNTTIPATFPAPYANRLVSVYIGPSFRPVVLGEDVARVFFDADNSTATGFRINAIGADYLAEVRGKYGVPASRSLSAFAGGASQLQWAWTPLETIPVASAYAQVELSFDLAGRGFQNDSQAYFEVRDWSGAFDPTAGPTIRTGTRDIAGNQKWFFTSGATTGTLCTTNLAASTTAGSSATSTTFSGTQSICWFTPLDVPDTVAGIWEVILDIDRVSNGTTSFSPSANGDANAWTAVGCTEANEYQCVDESANDGDTTYIVSNASVATDSLYNIPDWSSAPSPLTIVNVIVEASCRKTANPAVDARVILKSGTTTGVGGTSTNCALATYTVWSDTWTTDPADSSAWTLSDINALQVGVRDNDGTTREVRVSHVKATVTFAPVYSVEIDKCSNEACTSYLTLYGPTNSNTYGSDVTFTTGSIAAQTLSSSERIRFKITVEAGGSVRINYNGANPGASDSRATVPIPEFEALTIPLMAMIIVVPLVRRTARRRRAATPAGSGVVPRQ